MTQEFSDVVILNRELLLSVQNDNIRVQDDFEACFIVNDQATDPLMLF